MPTLRKGKFFSLRFFWLLLLLLLAGEAVCAAGEALPEAQRGFFVWSGGFLPKRDPLTACPTARPNFKISDSGQRRNRGRS
ncbi:uncharacterized protein K444DRAFT_316474 [Hyaloscypha bicolor E]|uniref:Secreted protein n=1 Tax=Hyaloscypha bicolor E TaxID=1095630 RepID=A0A2J6TLP8_9HELO|nr:uncharacterized protein K444DRAFT_316474 [Hyaloscypha bicolor E]PMD63927.1 hypothetical protein K444DRAFT_316474 [Hyaloscypha bicolor E]